MGNRIRVRLACLFVLLLTVVGTLPVWGQTTTAALRGTVTDPAGAVVPGAAITLSNVETGRTHDAESNESGQYYFSGLPPGGYTLTVEKQGFQRLVREGIVLTVNQVGQVDFGLTVGALAQEVVVRGGVALVETESATISGVVAEKQIKELPLNARDFYQLALLEPGVASIATNANPSPWQNTTNGKFAANGMRPTMTTTVLDGSEVSDPGHNQPLGGPSGSAFGVDSTREFRVLTNMYTAEFGRNSGAVVQVVTKSGSNTFNGSASEFFRNDALDAKNFFEGHREDLIEKHLYRVAIDGSGEVERLTTEGGWHDTTMSADASIFVDSYSSTSVPPRSILKSQDGSFITMIEANELNEDHPFYPYAADAPTREFGTLTAADGQTLQYFIRIYFFFILHIPRFVERKYGKPFE